MEKFKIIKKIQDKVTESKFVISRYKTTKKELLNIGVPLIKELFNDRNLRDIIADDLKPYHWYKNLVVLGARYLQFPDTYISSIEAVQSVEDPHEERRKEHEVLIEKIINYR